MGMIANLIGGLALHKANMNKSSHAANSSGLQYFLDAIDALSREISSIQNSSVDPLPRSVEKFIVFYCLSLRSECYWLLGEKSRALDLANQFLLEVTKAESKCVVAGVAQYLGFILHIFLKTGELDALNRLLQSIEGWAKLIPIVRTMQHNYLKQLEQILRSKATDKHLSIAGTLPSPTTTTIMPPAATSYPAKLRDMTEDTAGFEPFQGRRKKRHSFNEEEDSAFEFPPSYPQLPDASGSTIASLWMPDDAGRASTRRVSPSPGGPRTAAMETKEPLSSSSSSLFADNLIDPSSGGGEGPYFGWERNGGGGGDLFTWPDLT